ncbi:MAG: VWA domain-containing protein [Planctomycetota bacterium]
MQWNHPEALWLILPLSCLWLAVALYGRARRRRDAEAFVAAVLWPRILPPDSGARFWLKTALWLLALISGMVALAGPRFGQHAEVVLPRGSDLYVLIDVSRSMLAEDVPPSRLGRAKADVAELLQHLNGERIALIAFAGKAVVTCPLTTDYNYFRTALGELSPASAPRGGTAIGDAIRKALEVLPQDAERDQTLLLITDGDDQESQPILAAEAAAERHVAIFTVGLGDADKGSRVPASKDGAGTFMEYKGEQVWSKLHGGLLGEIALKTHGVYIPAGTLAYDLGELYQGHLKGRQAANAEQRVQMRASQQYQLFLALALFCLLLELLIRPYPPAQPVEAPVLPGKPTRRKRAPAAAPSAGSAGVSPAAGAGGTPALPGVDRTAGRAVALLLFVLCTPGVSPAAEAEQKSGGASKGETEAKEKPAAVVAPRKAVSEGLALYAKDDFEHARDKFGQAAEQFRKSQDSAEAAIAFFDAGCAAQRKGDTEKAREAYLEAGLARNQQLAAEAHFNLGCSAAESARTLAGERPAELAPDKRQEVIDKLLDAASRFRCCLGIQPAHAGARKNIELAREWVKYYTDKWRELDRQRRRREANLLQFLDYLISTERALREGVKELKPASPLDDFAEGKRLQEELEEEIGPLKEKIQEALAPPQRQQPSAQPGAAPAPQPQADPKQLEEALKLLQGWADAAGDKMKGAAERLSARQPAPAAEEQKGAVAELENIWAAVAPFDVVLARDLAEQTRIVHTLKPETDEEEAAKEGAAGQKAEEKAPDKKMAEKKAEDKDKTAAASGEKLLSDEESVELAEEQGHTGRRTVLLKLKAEQELKHAEQMPAGQPQPAPPVQQPGPKSSQDDDKKPAQPPAQLDPEKIKAGLRKAVELAPKAAEKMSAAAGSLRDKKAEEAYPNAEEARKILDEIAKAQPKQENKDQKKDQEKKDQKKDEEKKDEQKKDEQKKDEKKEQLSRDQIEAALRKVREREKQKHERDKELKARLLQYDRSVEKDW